MQQTNNYSNYNRNNRNNYNKYNPKQELKPLTKEEIFEKMIAKWKKDSEERLKAIKKNKNRWIENQRYTLSPFRKLK